MRLSVNTKKRLRQTGISSAAFLIKLLTRAIIWAIIIAARTERITMIIPNTIHNIIMNQTIMITIATTLWIITTITIVNRTRKALILICQKEL